LQAVGITLTQLNENFMRGELLWIQYWLKK